MATRVGFTTANVFAGDSGNVAASQLDTDFANLAAIVTDSGVGWSNFAADTGAANAYAVTLSPPAVAYTAGMLVNFVATNTNTGASTLNVNALGAQTIQNAFGQALSGGDIPATGLVSVVYTGSVFKVLSPIASNLLGGLNGGTFNFGNQRVVFDDFLGFASGVGIPVNTYFGSVPWMSNISAGAAVAYSSGGATSSLKAFGELSLSTGTSSSGISSALGGALFPGLGPMEIDFRANLLQLPTSAQNFQWSLGLFDINLGNNSIVFFGTFNVSAVLVGQCVTAGTSSSTTTQALTANAYHRYKILINSGWTSVSFFVDGVQLGSAIATNIPTTIALIPVFYMAKTSGTTTAAANIDQFYLSYIYTV